MSAVPLSARVLVTGAGGFIGSHLAADQRLRGHEVVALDLDLGRVQHLEEDGRFELVWGDVVDPGVLARALPGIDTVFHLAAAHLGIRTSEEEFHRVNVEGVRVLVQASEDAGVRRFVHCSSVGVYGRVDDPPADECTPCRPALPYEKSKLAGEEVVLEAVRERGFPAVVLRPVWVYGPGCPRTERLFRAVAKGRFVIGGRGDALRHSVYIRDMLKAFDLAAGAPQALGEVIVVGDAAAVPIRTLVEEIARVVGASRPRSVPLPALRLAAWIAEGVFRPLGQEPPISHRTLKFFTSNTAFDISKARTVLGYEPDCDLRTGLAETWRLMSEPGAERVPLPDPLAA